MKGLSVLIVFGMAADVLAVGASGLTAQLVGTKALGQGNAFAAQADDPSAIYYNPAGLTQLSGTQLMVGGDFLVPMVNRTGEGIPDDRMKRELSVLPMLYFTHAFKTDSDRRITLGIGLNSPFGLVTDWAPTSSVRYVATHSAFEMVEINPTVAVQLLPALSVGVGVDYVNLYNTMSDSSINQGALVPGAAEGSSHLSGHGQGWGYNAGILFKPAPRHSVAVSYRSQVQIPIKGSLELSNLDPTLQSAFNFSDGHYSTDATSSFILPQSVIGGYAYHPSERWTLLMDYEWTQWSVFQDQQVALQETDPSRLSLITGDPGSRVLTTPRHWHNVSALGGGASYQWSQAWQFRGGYAYYQKTVPNDTFNPDVPDAALHLASLGFSRCWTRLTLDAAFNGYFYVPREVHNAVGSAAGASVNGVYRTFIPAISVSLTYKLGH